MKKITVLIVDDSETVRRLLCEMLREVEDIDVVGEAEDPFQARELIKALNPDVLTLDVEMPKMDGITFLKNIMRLRPMPVVMLSSLTTKGADVTLEALEIGAIDYIAKPNMALLMALTDSFQQTLATKIREAASVDRRNLALTQKLRTQSAVIARYIEQKNDKGMIFALGASTGGTEAIKSVLQSLPVNAPPVVVVQHIPEKFSARFAARLDLACQVTVQEAKHEQKIRQGHVYIAPGDKHLKVARIEGKYYCMLDDSEPVSRHKPSVDVLFHSLVPIGKKCQAVLLTGMGDDGVNGLLALKRAGARTIVQDQATSLIWGMPGRAYARGAHQEVLPLEQIAVSLLDHVSITPPSIEDGDSEE